MQLEWCEGINRSLVEGDGATAAMENTRNVKSPRVCDGGWVWSVVDCDRNTEWSLMKRRRRRGKEGEKERKISQSCARVSYAFERARARDQRENGLQWTALVDVGARGFFYKKLRDFKSQITCRKSFLSITSLEEEEGRINN